MEPLAAQKVKEKIHYFQDWLHKLIASFSPQWNSKPLVAVDIGPESLRLLQLTSINSSYQVEHFHIAPISSGLIVKDEIKDFTGLGKIIAEACQAAKISSKDVAIAIPRAIGIIKNVTVDSRLSPNEIESRAWIEANRNFPDLVGDIFLDFVITGPASQDPSQLDLLLVACRKEQIKPYLEVVRQAGLNPKIVDVNCYALERALMLLEQSNSETVALLNLNINLSSFIVVHQQNLIHAHDQSYDGTRLMNQIKQYLKDKPQEAIGDNMINDSAYHDILKENLLSHLRHAVHSLYASRPNIAIQKFILSGDCANVPSLATFVQNEIGVNTSIAKPFSNMKISSSVNEAELLKHQSEFMQCIGLTLSKVIM